MYLIDVLKTGKSVEDKTFTCYKESEAFRIASSQKGLIRIWKITAHKERLIFQGDEKFFKTWLTWEG